MRSRLALGALLGLAAALALPSASGTQPLVDPGAATQRSFLASCETVTCNINLDLSKGGVPNPVSAGDRLTYTLTLQNHGPDPADGPESGNVIVSDTLPADTTFVSAVTNDPAHPTCDFNPQQGVAGTVNCFFGTVENTDQNKPPGFIGPRKITLVVIPNPTPPPPDYPRTIANIATVNADCLCTDTNPNNNRAIATTQVAAPGDLKLTKSHQGDPVPPATDFFYHLRVDNTGAAATLAAINPTGGTPIPGTPSAPFTVTDTLPHGFQFAGTEFGFALLAAPAAAGDTNIKVQSVNGFQPDMTVTVSATGANTDPGADTRVIATVGTAGAGGTGITFTTPLANAHPATDRVLSVDEHCTATPAGQTTNSTVTCSPDTSIPPGGHHTVFLSADPTQTGTFTNTASVSMYGAPVVNAKPQLDITPGDNTASDLTHVACPKVGANDPFLCVFKTDSQDPVPQGQQFTYTIRVQNDRTGVEDAFTDPVPVTDTLPPGMTVVSASVQNGSCILPPAGNQLHCTIRAPIPPGQSRTISVAVKAFQVGTFENIACLDFPREGGLAEPCANQPTTIIGGADLSIVKTASPNPVEVNAPLTYTMTVTNNGPGSVDNVQLHDTIPANVTFLSSSASPGTATCNLDTPADFHCNLGTMAPTTTKTLTVVVIPTVSGAITNTATVSNDGSPTAPVDFDLTNNTSSVTVDSRSADLAISKTVAPATVEVGKPATYTVKVTNNGPGVAAGVKVTDTLPGSVTSPQITTTAGTCSGSATITCNLGTMNPNDTVTITVKVATTAAGTATNTANVTGTSLDPDATNNQASVKLTITPKPVTAADVGITKSAGPNPVAFGTPLTYTLTVKNTGPARATGVTVSDSLPGGIDLPAVTTSQGSCSGSTTITCQIGSLDVDATATITIVGGAVVTGGSVTNTARVSSSSDPNAGNNSASVTTTVLHPALVTSPVIGTPGFVPSVLGTDFPANAPVQLKWAPGLGTQTVTAGPDGTFHTSILVFPNDIVGPRHLVAAPLQPGDPAKNFLSTNANFLVVPPTSQPFQVEPEVPITKLVTRSG